MQNRQFWVNMGENYMIDYYCYNKVTDAAEKVKDFKRGLTWYPEGEGGSRSRLFLGRREIY